MHVVVYICTYWLAIVAVCRLEFPDLEGFAVGMNMVFLPHVLSFNEEGSGRTKFQSSLLYFVNAVISVSIIFLLCLLVDVLQLSGVLVKEGFVFVVSPVVYFAVMRLSVKVLADRKRKQGGDVAQEIYHPKDYFASVLVILILITTLSIIVWMNTGFSLIHFMIVNAICLVAFCRGKKKVAVVATFAVVCGGWFLYPDLNREDPNVSFVVPVIMVVAYWLMEVLYQKIFPSKVEGASDVCSSPQPLCNET